MITNPVVARPKDRTSVGRPSNEQVWVALAHSYRALSSAVESSLLDSGLSLTDFMLLEALLHKGPLTITSIQASVLLASGSMTAAVDRLEKRGLIVRTATEADRRARVLQLTREGREVITEVYKAHRRQLDTWLDVLSAGDRADVFRILRTIERSVRNQQPEPDDAD